MLASNFKKYGVAAAVAVALGASGAAQAVVEGQPGGALLVPYVYATDTVNTLIGVTVVGSTLNSAQFAHVAPSGPGTPYGTLPNTFSNGCGATGAKLHWYFFDKTSTEVVNDTVPVTCEDFVRIDWNYLITSKGLPSAKGVPGYMVIGDNNAGTAASSLALYGATYLIQGNWASQAFIPVLPLYDAADGTAGDEVEHSGSFVADVNPASAGMLLPSTARTGKFGWFSLRYFLDPALKGSTTFVIWLPENRANRATQSINVYDADEKPISATTSIPYELNVVQVSPTATTVVSPFTAFIRDGLTHTNVDGSGVSAVGNAVNTGFVLFGLNDTGTCNATSTLPCEAVTATPTEGSRGGFAFSLIGIGGGAVADQLQTELAHERGVK